MRNLKKFLALVLAMMMALSLMATASAANVETPVTDVDQVTDEFQEAVQVLNGMGVITGYEDGTFRPSQSVRRSEAAALVYRLVTGDWKNTRNELYSTYVTFTDVYDSHAWAKGYIGYCANQEIIKGVGNGRYAPDSNVTGYQMLAMVLRAMGYGQNKEFEGTGWQTRVASTATQLGMLKQIDNTNYAGTLSASASRELVAEILFQAAQLPMVRYELGYYNPYVGVASGTGNNILNPSLGYRNYGLTNDTGIVLGNQATGEDDETVIGIAGSRDYIDNTGNAKYTTWNEYQYNDVELVAAGSTSDGNAINVPRYAFDVETGLDLFGHKVKVWYNAKDSYPMTTYAIEDKAELAATITATAAEKIGKTQLDADAGANNLSAAAKAAGFTIETADTQYYSSLSFSRLTASRSDVAVTATAAKVYVLISNNVKKTVDVVIPVKTAAAQITKVNNWSTTKQITLDTTLGAFALDTAADYNQKIITSDASKFVVGSKVIATEITHNTKDGTYNSGDPVYWLDTVPAPSKTGTVVDFNSTNQTVTLSDGTKLKRTIINNDAISANTGNYAVKTATATTFKNMTYKFTLDMQGNWLHAEPVDDNQFIYATYVDYFTTPGSSTFTYNMVGVDLNGEMVTKTFTKYALASAPGTTVDLVGGEAAGKISLMGVPYYDQSASGSGLAKRDVTDDTSAQAIFYKGFISSGDMMDNGAQTLYDIAGIQSLAGSETINKDIAGTGTVYDFVGNSTAANDTTITRADTEMGVALVDTANAAGNSTNPYLYLTEKTKFIVVDGYGTDSCKPVVYNGISGLLGSASSVTINTSSDTSADATADGRAAEIYFTCSDYEYSNTGVISKQADTVILPKEALKFDNGSNLYFFHKVTSTVKDTDGGAYLFTAYQGAEEVRVWVDKDNVAAADGTVCSDKGTTKLAADHFLLLEDSGEKAADGQPIYTTKALSTTAGSAQNAAPDGTEPKAICFDGAAGAAPQYQANTMNTQTALLGTNLVNVANAKVVNLDTDNGTIESMEDLNQASSVKTVTVCVEYASAGSKVISAIYVVGIA